MARETNRRLTRRQLVAAGVAATAAAGLGGVTAVGPDRVYRRLTRDCGDAPAPPPRSDAVVEEHRWHSNSHEIEVPYTIAWPPGLRGERGLPVCFCLPGRGADHGYVTRTLRLHDELALAIDRGAPPFALVSMSGGESYWHARPGGEDRMELLLSELLPLTEIEWGLSTTKLAVIGWSMGGYGALLAAVTAPHAFRAVVASSPALWTRYEDAVPDAFDSRADFERHDVFDRRARLRELDVRIDCGESDPFVDACRTFVTRVPHAETSFATGCHDSRYWRRAAPDQLDFLGRALA